MGSNHPRQSQHRVFTPKLQYDAVRPILCYCTTMHGTNQADWIRKASKKTKIIPFRPNITILSSFCVNCPSLHHPRHPIDICRILFHPTGPVAKFAFCNVPCFCHEQRKQIQKHLNCGKLFAIRVCLRQLRLLSEREFQKICYFLRLCSFYCGKMGLFTIFCCFIHRFFRLNPIARKNGSVRMFLFPVEKNLLNPKSFFIRPNIISNITFASATDFRPSANTLHTVYCNPVPQAVRWLTYRFCL